MRWSPQAPGIERDSDGVPIAVRVSALTGAGLDLLRAALVERFSPSLDSAVLDYDDGMNF